MEPSLTRQQMERFTGLRPCLRKPCPWMGNCRNLHISYGKPKEKMNLITSNNRESRSRVFEMPGGPASRCATSTEEDGTTRTQEGGFTGKEGLHAGEKKEAITKTCLGVPQKEQKEVQVQNPFKLGRAPRSAHSHGEADGKKEEEVEGEEEEERPPPLCFINQSKN